MCPHPPSRIPRETRGCISFVKVTWQASLEAVAHEPETAINRGDWNVSSHFRVNAEITGRYIRAA